MDQSKLKLLLEKALEYSKEYIDSVEERPIFPSDSAIRDLDHFDVPLPMKESDPAETLFMLHEYGSPATVAQTGGRYFGFVNGGLHPAGLATRWLADTWDQNAALYAMSPVASRLESICEKWLVDLFNLDKDTAMGLVSGTSSALVCGLVAGRNHLLEKQGWIVSENGLMGAPEIRIIISEHAHGTVLKALSLIGLGTRKAIRVPCDNQGRMQLEGMPPMDSSTLIIAGAGEVNSGSFDDLKTIGTLARAADAWVHVDGAFGLWAATSSATYPLYDGAQLADSWSVDAHKTLNVPYDCGIVLCRHRNALSSALQASGSYIQRSENRDGMSYTMDMSRRARVVELWAVLRTLGGEGIAALVDQLCARARLFAELLTAEGFEVLNEVLFNQVLVASGSDSQTKKILQYVQDSGICWCSGSIWRGRVVIRISVCSYMTTEQDVERSVQAFVAAKSMI
ncbi:MAG: aminotransferase class V-fold PLP-dependent enzyme [Gammaproteobacteria bacterium]|nr:aminotransferase class V-fold PLP-dependent enzyme [Gammaproteobacteria bacterium]